jgi:FKBP-type peptidyl-prolyl cis-trans isomerase 2
MADAKLGSKLKVRLVIKDENGEVFQKTADEPNELVLGEGTLIPGIEVSLVGMNPGDSKTVELKPKMHYGERNEEAVVEMDKEGFSDDVKVEKGETLEYRAEDGATTLFRIVDVNDEMVKLDGNHPLAGQTIAVDIKVEDVE